MRHKGNRGVAQATPPGRRPYRARGRLSRSATRRPEPGMTEWRGFHGTRKGREGRKGRMGQELSSNILRVPWHNAPGNAQYIGGNHLCHSSHWSHSSHSSHPGSLGASPYPERLPHNTFRPASGLAGRVPMESGRCPVGGYSTKSVYFPVPFNSGFWAVFAVFLGKSPQVIINEQLTTKIEVFQLRSIKPN